MAKLQREKDIQDQLDKAYWAISDLYREKRKNQGKQVWSPRQQNEMGHIPDALGNLRDAVALLFSALREPPAP